MTNQQREAFARVISDEFIAPTLEFVTDRDGAPRWADLSRVTRDDLLAAVERHIAPLLAGSAP